MTKSKHLNKLIEHYINDEIKHFNENYQTNKSKKENLDNHILGAWYKVVEEFNTRNNHDKINIFWDTE